MGSALHYHLIQMGLATSLGVQRLGFTDSATVTDLLARVGRISAISPLKDIVLARIQLRGLCYSSHSSIIRSQQPRPFLGFADSSASSNVVLGILRQPFRSQIQSRVYELSEHVKLDQTDPEASVEALAMLVEAFAAAAPADGVETRPDRCILRLGLRLIRDPQVQAKPECISNIKSYLQDQVRTEMLGALSTGQTSLVTSSSLFEEIFGSKPYPVDIRVVEPRVLSPEEWHSISTSETAHSSVQLFVDSALQTVVQLFNFAVQILTFSSGRDVLNAIVKAAGAVDNLCDLLQRTNCTISESTTKVIGSAGSHCIAILNTTERHVCRLCQVMLDKLITLPEDPRRQCTALEQRFRAWVETIHLMMIGKVELYRARCHPTPQWDLAIARPVVETFGSMSSTTLRRWMAKYPAESKLVLNVAHVGAYAIPNSAKLAISMSKLLNELQKELSTTVQTTGLDDQNGGQRMVELALSELTS